MNPPAARRSLAARAAALEPGTGLETDGVRLQLLEIAEKLFAELGVENTPLQRIVEEGGQRNRSVLNYHFGSRRDLLAALLDLRTNHMNDLRHQYLDAVEAAEEAGNVAILLRATYQPLVDGIHDEPWGRNYVQVMAQVVFNPTLAAHELINAHTTSAMRRVRDLLALALPGVPEETIVARMVWSADVIVHTLARWCRDGSTVWNAEGPIDDMFDFVAHGLLAPVTVPAARRGLVTHQRVPSGLARWLDKKID